MQDMVLMGRIKQLLLSLTAMHRHTGHVQQEETKAYKMSLVLIYIYFKKESSRDFHYSNTLRG